MTSWPLALTPEILVDGAWQPVSMREDPTVTVARGASAEGTAPQPGRATVTLDNRDGHLSPRNPMSPLYGKIGRNTRFRLRVDDLPAEPAPDVTDAFDRTEANGWGTSDTGDVWTIYDPFGTSPPSSAYSVADGTGRITPILSSGRYIRADGTDLADLDATYTVMTEERAQGTDTEGAVFASFLARIDPVAHSFYRFNVGFRVDTGLPGGAGLRVAPNINKIVAGSGSLLNVQKSVPGLVYEPGVPLRVRVQCIGGDLRVRVWADGSAEPQAWHSQAYDEELTTGEVGFIAVVDSAPGTTLPFDVHFGDLSISEPATDTGVVRIIGEIPAWPPRRDLSGSDIHTTVSPAGILRRLSAGNKPLKSVMRRHIPPLFPLAYWPMEEGAQGERRVADATGNTGPMRVARMEFARDSDLIGSDPLPQLTKAPLGSSSGSLMVSPPIPGVETGSWSVYLMFRISEDDFPGEVGTSGEKTILAFTVTGSTATHWVVALYTNGGNRTMKLTVRDEGGAELAAVNATHEAAVAGGGPGLLDAWRRLRVFAVTDGADTDFRVDWLDLDGINWGNGGTLAGTTPGRVHRIETYFGSESADGEIGGLALGHLSVWGVQATTAYLHTGVAALGLGGDASTQGLRRQTTRTFLDRLSAQEGIPLAITGPGEERLGPYPTGTFLDLVHRAAVTEMGIFGEARSTLSLTYRTRETLYNADPELTLDHSDGQIFDSFEPTDDDKDVRNAVTVTRREGSEATAVLQTGPVSVRPPPDGIGEYETSVETIVDADSQLPDQAGWRLHVAAVDEMRVVKLTLKMGNPRMQPLIDQVLLLDVGSRIRIINLPGDLPPDGFDLRVTGYSETFATGRWDITFSCVPASPWRVGVWDTDRYGTAGSELASDAAADDTTVHVRTVTGPAWTTDPTEFPVNLRMGGEVVTATAAAAAPSDQPALGDGDASESASTSHVAPTLTAPGATDLLVCAWCSWSATGTYTVPGSMTEQDETSESFSTLADATETVSAGATGTRTATFNSSDAWSAVSVLATGTPVVEEQLSGSDQSTQVTLTTDAGTEAGWWLLAVQGWDEDSGGEQAGPDGDGWLLVADSGTASGATSRTTAWAKRVTEDGAQAVTFPAPGSSATDGHARLYVLSGVTDLRAQAMTITRSVNGIEKSHTAGTAVELAQPAVRAL